MKIGTATSVLYQYELKDAVPLVARAGFDGIDVWGGRPHVYRQDFSLAELSALRKLIAGHGLEVSSFMPAFYRYPHSLSNPNPRVREDSLGYMRESIDNAAALAAKVVLVVPDISLFGQSRQDSLERFIESLDAIARYALQYDLKLGIEILYLDETDLVNTSKDAIKIIQRLRHPNLGAVVDSGTLNLSKESIQDVLNTLGQYLLQVHVNDNNGHEKQQNLIPGEGTFDFYRLIKGLNDWGYDGFISAELSKEYASDPEPALKATVERLRAWIRRAAEHPTP
jgi:fructoselysine 3-epimerase